MATQIAEIMEQLATAVAPSQKQSMKDLNGYSEADHKRAFLETFRRWEVLFKRKDSGDTQADKWLIAEYYDSLKHLSPKGFDALTRLLKENCIFFPTIKECLDAMRPRDHFDYAHPFLAVARKEPSSLLVQTSASVAQLESSNPRRFLCKYDHGEG